jgi:hypothetical protein
MIVLLVVVPCECEASALAGLKMDRILFIVQQGEDGGMGVWCSSHSLITGKTNTDSAAQHWWRRASIRVSLDGGHKIGLLTGAIPPTCILFLVCHPRSGASKNRKLQSDSLSN